jgi:nickel-dependent lactate racemase
MSLGVIEPHLYAGYSGGVKTVAIGLAGEATIDATHGVSFLKHPGTSIGALERNPFHAALEEIASKVPLTFSVNVVNDPDGAPLRLFYGDTRKVFADGVAYARSIFEVTVDRPADIVVCAVGHPKDVNLYQASRAVNYVLNVDRPVLRKGGLLVLVAALGDGIGRSRPERRFYTALKRMTSPAEFIAHIENDGCVAGGHRAYMIARPLLDYDIAIVNREKNPFLKGLPFPVFGRVEDALLGGKASPDDGAKIYIIPRALVTVARLKG